MKETLTKQAHLLDPVTNQLTYLHVLTTPNHAIDPYDQHRIRLKQPYNDIYVRPNRRSLAYQQEIDRQVKTLLDQVFIRESKSPWAFGTTLAPK